MLVRRKQQPYEPCHLICRIMISALNFVHSAYRSSYGIIAFLFVCVAGPKYISLFLETTGLCATLRFVHGVRVARTTHIDRPG